MKAYFGQCDWCRESRRLSRLEYVDGKHHHSCQECLYLAKIDVNLFNQEELVQRAKLSQQRL